MRGNFERALARVLVYEGGNDDDPQDPGGRTSRGILQREYDVYRRRKGLPVRDVWTADQAEIIEIYRVSYWDAVRGDELPPGIDLVLFDSAVNSGVAQAAKWVQRALPIEPVDGHLGPRTFDAIQADADNDLLIDGILSRRLGMLQGLKTWSRFGRGWAARVANVKKIGQAWASGSVGPPPARVADLGGHRKAKPVGLSEPPVSAGTANVTALMSTTGAAASEAATQIQPLADAFATLKWVFIALTVIAVAAGIAVKVLSERHGRRVDGSAIAPVPDDADEDLDSVPITIGVGVL
jgi:lysozyme family protein